MSMHCIDVASLPAVSLTLTLTNSCTASSVVCTPHPRVLVRLEEDHNQFHEGDTQARNQAGGDVSPKRFRWQLSSRHVALGDTPLHIRKSEKRNLLHRENGFRANKNESRGKWCQGNVATETQHVCTIALKTADNSSVSMSRLLLGTSRVLRVTL